MILGKTSPDSCFANPISEWPSQLSIPLEAIERIAQSRDRLLAIQFFLFFSRFEYALKCLGRIKKVNNFPTADWDGYAKCSGPVWLKAKENADFREALEFLDRNPPRQQTFEGQKLVWAENSRSGHPASLEKVLFYVRTVRNNLFHGSKLASSNPTRLLRDRELIKRCLIVLAVCLEGDRKLRSKFLEGLD